MHLTNPLALLLTTSLFSLALAFPAPDPVTSSPPPAAPTETFPLVTTNATSPDPLLDSDSDLAGLYDLYNSTESAIAATDHLAAEHLTKNHLTKNLTKKTETLAERTGWGTQKHATITMLSGTQCTEWGVSFSAEEGETKCFNVEGSGLPEGVGVNSLVVSGLE